MEAAERAEREAAAPVAAPEPEYEYVEETERAVSPADAATYANGVDVSHYQGLINWTQVAAKSYRFTFAKATEGTSSMTWRAHKAMPGAAITERPTAIAASGLTQHRASK